MSLKPPQSPTTSNTPDPGEWVNVQDFGAVGNGTTDDTVAIQAAIDSLPGVAGSPRGGVVYFPLGVYKVTSALDVADSENITLLGATLNSANETATTGSAASRINYTGTSATRLIDARSTYALTLQGLAVTHTGAWSGIMVDFAHSGSGGDSQHGLIENCALAGIGQNTCTLVSWRNAIFCRAENSYFGRSAYAIRMRENTGDSVAYSNSHTIRDCQFARCNEGVVNGGDGLLVDGCGFEGTGGNIQHAYLDDITATPGSFTCGGHSWVNNWLGDAFSAIPSHWMDYGQCIVTSASYVGNLWQNDKNAFIFRRGFSGLAWVGNSISGSTSAGGYAIDLGTTIGRGAVLIGNSIGGPAAEDAIKNRAIHRQKLIAGNVWAAATGAAGFDEFTGIAQHLHGENDIPPTVSSKHANTGSGSSVVVLGSDMAGRISLTTGTGAGAGVSNLVVFNAYKTFDTTIPFVQINPANQAAAALGGWYGAASSVTDWNLGLDTGKTLSSSTLYQFNYQVI